MGVTPDMAVSVWQWLDDTTWARLGVVKKWYSLSVEQRHLQPGPWSMQLPYNAQTAKIAKGHLLTFDFRGQRLTGRVTHRGYSQDPDSSGRPVLELQGVDALDILGGYLCWPIPLAPLPNQGMNRYENSGPAEDVLASLIYANVGARRDPSATYPAIDVVPSQGRGGHVVVALSMHNLLTRVLAESEIGGLGVSVGLVPQAASNRATLRCWFYAPEDKSQRARLSYKVKTLRSWSQSDDAPTGTQAIIRGGPPGADRVFRSVVDSAAEAEWGWRREVFVRQQDTIDPVALDNAGLSELADAAEQSSFELEAVDSPGMRYGEHFRIGDLITIELLTGVSKVDRLNVVTVTSDSPQSALKVTLQPGNPDAANPLFAQAAILRGLRKQVRDLQLED